MTVELMAARRRSGHSRPSAAVSGGLSGAAVCCLLLALAACSADPSGKTLSADTSVRVCQLTGDVDWLTGLPTTSRSESEFGLIGTDLGYPVEHNGRMALLFGDSRINPSRGATQLGPPDDAIGWVSTFSPPTPQRCLDLVLNHRPEDARALVSPTVAPAINQGLFNVPSGGVSSDCLLYGFFWTDHCLFGNDPATCPGTEALNKVGRGVMARSSDDGQTFVDPVELPRDFVYATAVDSLAISDLPAEQRIGVYVFGVPRYRESVPHLAYAPRGSLGNPKDWLFFTGLRSDGQPSWTTGDVWARRPSNAPPPGRPDLFDADGQERFDADGQERRGCVGEFSMTWNRALRAWLLLYNCSTKDFGDVIMARVAVAPWGPWSRASILLDPYHDNGACQLFWKVPGKGNGCDDRVDEWPGPGDKGKINGGFYAPFVMERYTAPERTFRPFRRRATVYWLLSTYNPYQVFVMKTSLTVDEPGLARLAAGTVERLIGAAGALVREVARPR